MNIEEQVQFAEEDIAYLKGHIEAISSLCALLIATHPRGGKIVEVFKARASVVERLEQPKDALKAYADGFVRLAYDLEVEKILEAFQRDELELFPIPQSRGH